MVSPHKQTTTRLFRMASAELSCVRPSPHGKQCQPPGGLQPPGGSGQTHGSAPTGCRHARRVGANPCVRPSPAATSTDLPEVCNLRGDAAQPCRLRTARHCRSRLALQPAFSPFRNGNYLSASIRAISGLRSLVAAEGCVEGDVALIAVSPSACAAMAARNRAWPRPNWPG